MPEEYARKKKEKKEGEIARRKNWIIMEYGPKV